MSQDYIDHVIDMLASWSPVTARKMFGGCGFYRDGLMFGIYAGEAIYFKVDDSNRSDYEAAGAEPFSYEAKGKRVTTSYWQVPADVLDDENPLGEWATKAYAAAVAAAAAKKPAERAPKARKPK